MEIEELQRNWDLFGRTDPLWSILTDPRGRNRTWNEAEFFESGRKDIEAVFGRLDALGAAPRRGRALDFGCGVGRLTQAMCLQFDSVLGLDIAPSMIDLANRYNKFGDRCRYAVNDRDDLSRFADGTFDFVFTLMVLQHMRPQYSQRYLAEFLRVTAPGGLIVFQVPSVLKFQRARALPRKAFRALIEPVAPPATVKVGERASLTFRVTNTSDREWPPLPQGQPMALNLGNHWRDANGRMCKRDDARSALPGLAPGQTVRVQLVVTAPSVPGEYDLELDLVQEGVCWFGERGSPTCRIPVEIRIGAQAAEAPQAPDGGAPISGEQPPEPAMEMYCLPRSLVEETVWNGGGEILAALEHHCCGAEYENFQYFVRKGTPPSSARRLARAPRRLARRMSERLRAGLRRLIER